MQNPFETGHIKNYILLYVSVVVIMVLFFIATTLFHDVGSVEKKLFNSDIKSLESAEEQEHKAEKENSQATRFKLLDKSY